MTDREYLDAFNREYWSVLQTFGVDGLSRLQRDGLCVLNFQVKLNNGGMHQYLFNTSGDFAKETPDVFRRIGADAAAQILAEANAFFGLDGPPEDRAARMELLLVFPKNVEDRVYALTNEFYLAEDRGLVLADLFDAYVLSQRAAK